MNENKNAPGKKKKSFPGFLIVIILMALAGVLEDLPGEAVAVVIPLVITLFIAVFVASMARAAARKAGGAEAQRASARQPVRSYRAAPEPPGTRAHRSPAVRTGAPLRPGRDDPDAYCLVCHQTGVDHFERDKQQRLRQLDYWLSIGLIERTEYNLLRTRYSRDVPHQTVI